MKEASDKRAAFSIRVIATYGLFIILTVYLANWIVEERTKAKHRENVLKIQEFKNEVKFHTTMDDDFVRAMEKAKGNKTIMESLDVQYDDSEVVFKDKNGEVIKKYTIEEMMQ